MTEVCSTFQKRPCYRYIRDTDQLPTYEELGDLRFKDITCLVKLFNPTGIGTWWIAAYDPDDEIAWGVAELFEREVGSFSISELVDYRDKRMGLPIERDLYYDPVTIETLLA